MLDSTSFDYDSITVEGPESIVGTIDCAQVTLDRSNVDKTITETVSYVLLDKDGDQVDTSELTLSADAVEVTMKIVKYKVVPLEVEFIDGGGAKAETDVTYTADIQAVTLSGDVTVLDGLNSIQLEPIDLSTLSSNDETITRTILIPNDVKNVSGQEEVSIHVIIHGKQIKTLRTTNIVFIGVDEEKFKATSLSQQVQVTIRADAADAQKILAGNIRIVADMSGYTQEGTYQVPVSVYVDGYDSAGAIGQYSIAANLAPATAEGSERKERNVIRSMTGYGRAEKTIDGREITVEMRAVNNRYLDLQRQAPARLRLCRGRGQVPQSRQNVNARQAGSCSSPST